MLLKPKGQDQPETPQRRLEDEVSPTETVIGNRTKFHGTIQGQDSVRIAGFFEGDVDIEGRVWIDKRGEVQGTIKAPGMIVEGQINGDLVSSEKIEVRASGRVLGSIRCRTLAMAEGCFVQGEIKMLAGGSEPLTFVEKRQGGKEEGEMSLGKEVDAGETIGNSG